MKLCLLPIVLLASIPLHAQAPLPTALIEAKTVYLVNAGVHTRIMANTVKALKDWPRWTVVADASAADITLTLSAQPTKIITNVGLAAFGLNPNMPINSSFVSITGQDGVALFGAVFAGGNPKRELSKLRKQLEP